MGNLKIVLAALFNVKDLVENAEEGNVFFSTEQNLGMLSSVCNPEGFPFTS